MKVSPLPSSECIRAWEHTPCPSGYLSWHAWAEQMDRMGYRQATHEVCGLWTQWLTPTGRPARISVRRVLEASVRHHEREARKLLTD